MVKSAIPFIENKHHCLELIGDRIPALFSDFDGTLSELNTDPRKAFIDPQCLSAISRLRLKLPAVAIISGRMATDVRDRVGLDKITYVGNHGAEQIVNGVLSREPGATNDSKLISTVLNYLQSRVSTSGIFFEYKKVSASIHYRCSGNRESTYQELSLALQEAPNIQKLDVFWGREILEIRPLSGFHKGYALRKLIRENEIKSLVYVGDDTTDIDAFQALRTIRDEGEAKGISAVVESKGMNKKLLEKADIKIRGIVEMREFLSWLLNLAY